MGLTAFCHSTGVNMRIINRREAARLALVAPFAIAASTEESEAYSRFRIDTDVHATLREFTYHIGGARELLAKASAVLVFPSVFKAGLGVGGEGGEGVPLSPGGGDGHCNKSSVPVGFELWSHA